MDSYISRYYALASMLSFLFWNLNRKHLVESLVQLIQEHAVDVVILTESEVPSGVLLGRLTARGLVYHHAGGISSSFSVFTRFHPEFFKPQHDSNNLRISIRRIALPGRDEVLLAMAHLPSRLYFTRESIDIECMQLSQIIKAQEKITGHRRTVLVGDLNANPFDVGIVSTEGLHAAMTRQIALGRTRTVQGNDYPFFYNPMWGHFGDRTEGASGTYFYDRAEHVTYFWNIFDQVLLRPELIGFFDPKELKILTSAGSTSLTDHSGRPNREIGSDHLPITFRLNI